MTNMTAWPWACTDTHDECRCRWVWNKCKHKTNNKKMRKMTRQIGFLRVLAQLYTPCHPPAAEGLIGVGETSHNNGFTNEKWSSRGLLSRPFAYEMSLLTGWFTGGAEGTHPSCASVPLAAVSSSLNRFSRTAARARRRPGPTTADMQIQQDVFTCGHRGRCAHQDIMSGCSLREWQH